MYENKHKRLAYNSLIYGIGIFGSKIIIFFLVPLYTYALTKAEYGKADLLLCTATLLFPVISLNISEGVLRFAFDKDENRQTVFTNALKINAVAACLMLLFIFPVKYLFQIHTGVAVAVIALFIIQITQAIFKQMVRALGESRLFAVTGIVNAVVLLVISAVTLLYLKWSLFGYFLSFILAALVESVLLFTQADLYKYIDFRQKDSETFNRMVAYSLPLIPNTIMWWLIGVSDRYIVTFYCGIAAAGLYAVAHKLPSVINVIAEVFYKSWQATVFEEKSQAKLDSFFSATFSALFALMMMVSTLILTFIKPIMKVFVAPEFFSAWQYVPFLLIAAVFSCFAAFCSVNYSFAKNSSRTFVTAIPSAVVSIIVGIILVPHFGYNGAAFSTMLSYLIMWLIRLIDSKNYNHIKVNYFIVITSLSVLFVQISAYKINSGDSTIMKIQLLLNFFMLLLNGKHIVDFIKQVIGSRKYNLEG